MVAFYNTVNRRKENIEVALSQGLLLWKRLVDYDRKIRKFHPKFLEYRELCLNADFKNIKESGFLEGQLNTWYDNVTRVLDEIDQSEIGKAISPRLNKQISLETDTDNLRSVLDLIIKTYNKYHEIGEELIYRKIGWVQKETSTASHQKSIGTSPANRAGSLGY